MNTVTPAGKLKHRVILVQRDNGRSTANELGETVYTSQELGTVWAWVRPLKSWEIAANAQNTLNTTHEVRMRYTDQITHADSLLFGTRVLDIVGDIDNDEETREVRLTCNEQKP